MALEHEIPAAPLPAPVVRATATVEVQPEEASEAVREWSRDTIARLSREQAAIDHSADLGARTLNWMRANARWISWLLLAAGAGSGLWR